MQVFHDDLISKLKKLIKYNYNDGKKIQYEWLFMSELCNYSLKLYNNGEYYSTIFLKNLAPPNIQKKSPLYLLKFIRHRDIVLDTLMGFTIMRSRLEEMILNLYFLFKSKNLIKEKKWFDLYVLIMNVNYSNYDKEIGLKITNKARSKRRFIERIVKKNKRLHTEQMKKFVLSKKFISDDYKPSFYLPSPDEGFLTFSLKPIDQLYSMLSDQLHPNNLFLRNLITLPKKNIEKSIILKDHIYKLHQCSKFITDISETIYKQNTGVLDYFFNKIDGSEKDKLILEGFRQSIQNNLK